MRSHAHSNVRWGYVINTARSIAPEPAASGHFTGQGLQRYSRHVLTAAKAYLAQPGPALQGIGHRLQAIERTLPNRTDYTALNLELDALDEEAGVIFRDSQPLGKLEKIRANVEAAIKPHLDKLTTGQWAAHASRQIANEIWYETGNTLASLRRSTVPASFQ